MAGHDEWQTPMALYRLIEAEFGFELDSAANARNAKCVHWLTDGLTEPWSGRTVWCNPPYSDLPTWVARAWQQCQEQRNTVVMLIPAYTDPKYWSEIVIAHADEVRFLKGRVSFLENGLKKMSARFPSAVVVFRYRPGVQQKHAHCWWWDLRDEMRAQLKVSA